MRSDLDTSALTMGGQYSFAKAASLLGVDRTRVYKWAKAGKLAYYYNELGQKYVTGFEIASFYNGAYDPATGRPVLLQDGRPVRRRK